MGETRYVTYGAKREVRVSRKLFAKKRQLDTTDSSSRLEPLVMASPPRFIELNVDLFDSSIVIEGPLSRKFNERRTPIVIEVLARP